MRSAGRLLRRLRAPTAQCPYLCSVSVVAPHTPIKQVHRALPSLSRFTCSATPSDADTHFSNAMTALQDAYNKTDPDAPFDFAKVETALDLLAQVCGS